MCCNQNELIDIGEKLASVRFELLNMAHKCYKSRIFRSACLWFTDRTHSALCAFCSCAQLQVKIVHGHCTATCPDIFTASATALHAACRVCVLESSIELFSLQLFKEGVVHHVTVSECDIELQIRRTCT